jgi:hypothetical protein
MENTGDVATRVARLNLQGVSAMNRNDHAAARKYFDQAYRLAPNNAFTLNNMGFLSEMDGDRETADFYYNKAAEAQGRSERVSVATRREVEGRPVGQVAEYGDTQIAARMEQERQARIREGGPVLLKTRSGTPIVEPEHAPPPLPSEPVRVHEEYKAPETAQPAAAQPAAPPAPKPQPRPKPDPSLGPLPGSTEPMPPAANPGEVKQPLPDNQQPPAAQSQQPARPGGIIEPLPDNQQPPAAQAPPQNRPPNQ